MPDVTREFDNYVLTYLSAKPAEAQASITCRKGTQLVGQIAFVGPEVALPANYTTNGMVFIYFPLRRFDHVIMTLREEKPLYLNFSPDTGAASIKTGLEPVGDLEGV